MEKENEIVKMSASIGFLAEKMGVFPRKQVPILKFIFNRVKL